MRKSQLEYHRKWREEHPGAHALSMRKYHLKRFGLTLADYEALLVQQNGACAICGGTPGARCLAVDHDHVTGKVRGLLCGVCNRAIGMLEDSPEMLDRAAAYLRGL